MAGIYLHIPFCHGKCAYCDFYSMGSKPNVDISLLQERLIKAIGQEYAMRVDELDASPIETIYIGGGTPSILHPRQLQDLVSNMPVTYVKEFTIEANPEDITLDGLNSWKKLGINRISMGVQSLNDRELKVIGRRHSAQQALDAIELMRNAGFGNFSVDLIYGLPMQTLDSWEHSLHTILSLQPAHLSAYMLSYEEGTRLTRMLKAGQIAETDDDTLVEMYSMLTAAARQAGYEHYEISNFAFPGHKAVHNANYWKSIPYLGLGPSAHSYDGNVRRINPGSIMQYIRRIEEGNHAFEIEEETKSNRLNDAIMVSLRTADGLDLSSLPSECLEPLLHEAQSWIESGQLISCNGWLRIPEEHWLMSDAIISSLLFVE